jgi:carboxypeptidase T
MTLKTFATAEAISGYHSVETLELAASQPEITELREIGHSVENRPLDSVLTYLCP